MKKPKKGVIEKYYKALVAVEKQFENLNYYAISNVLKEHGLNTANVSALKDLGIIEKTNLGTKWIGDKPSFEMALAVRNRFVQNREYQRLNKTQQLFEWQKPQPTVNIEPKYEFTPQPDTSSVSEFIDHHEQSLLPPPIKRVKTPKNDKKERLFQLRIFGINLFTVKY